MVFSAHIMTGVAGKGRGMENAKELAKFLNQTEPVHVVNFSMFLHKEVPLYRHMEDGSYIPADELENLKEERRLLELLEAPLLYDGLHDYIEKRFRGRLPDDRYKMTAKLDQAIEDYEKREPVYSYVQGECPDLVRCDGCADRADERIWNMKDKEIKGR